MRWWIAVALAGCEPDPTLRVHVHVTDEVGADLAGATVQALCDPNGYGAAAYTDDAGLARLALFFEEPAPCVVTVSRDGFQTLRAEDVEPCLDDTCAVVDLALARVP